MKKCCKCCIDKNESEFYIHRNKCKHCIIERRMERYRQDIAKTAEYASEYRKKNKTKLAKDKANYHRQNRIKIAANKKQYREKNKIKIAAHKKEYREKNKNKISEHARWYQKNRAKIDLIYKLTCALRSRLYKAIKNNYKTGSAIRDLGCTVEELKAHLEAKFYQNYGTGEVMTWNNWSPHGWHIDHIIPLATIETAEDKFAQTKICCHYTNLQPLWAKENLSKGAKIEDRL